MLIRSQDKLKSVSYESGLWIIVGGDIRYLSPTDTNFFMVFGTYASQAKAIKVLDKIQQVYESSLYCDHAYDNAAQVQRPYIFVNNTVFQMPSDEQVEG